MIALTLTGQPGSGKTTLARLIAENLGLHYIGSGDIAREMAQQDPGAQEALKVGEMAPELAMRREVLMRIEAATVATGDFVIDGFPRTIEQLHILESIPKIQPLYFLLEVDPLICLRRLVQRGRNGDHPDAIGTRFRAYHELTEPMLEIVASALVTLDAQLHTSILLGQVKADYQTEARRVG